MKTFRIKNRNTGVKKLFAIALIMAVMITMIPTDTSAYTDYPCTTNKADADLFPFPYDMNVLSQYLYGSEKNLTGKVKSNYFKRVPREWYARERPSNLICVGIATVNKKNRGGRTAAPVYFYPGYTTKNWHDQRIADLSKTVFAYRGPGYPNSTNQNIAFYCAETTEFEILGYNDQWVAVWDVGGIDVGCGLSTTCGGIGTEQYGSWKPAVYFIKRSDVYIMDSRNKDLNVPKVTASGTATCDILVKTTPASDKYVASGLIKSNQLFQVTNPTPINGHYQIYYRNGLYYVNARWVNLKRADEKRGEIAYTAVVTSSDSVDIKASPSDSASVVGAAKRDFKVDVVKKNAGNGYSQIWFNSKECYIKTKTLGNFTGRISAKTISKLGKAKGTLFLNGPWSSYGATAYSAEAIKILKKYKMDESRAYRKLKAANGSYPMSDGDSGIVYSKSKFVISKKYKEYATIYKILYNGMICYVPIKSVEHTKFNYYKTGKGKVKTKSESKYLTITATRRAQKEANVETYKIKGRYYFKLDDIANLMSPSNKSFKVAYKKNCIVVNSMCPYSGSASLKKGDGKSHYAVPSTMSIIWDGKAIGIPCYKISGKYYVNIHDIAYMTDSEIVDGSAGGYVLGTTYPNEVEAYG